MENDATIIYQSIVTVAIKGLLPESPRKMQKKNAEKTQKMLDSDIFEHKCPPRDTFLFMQLWR